MHSAIFEVPLLAQAEQFWLPVEGSTTAGEVDWVFMFIFWISFFFFALIVGLMTYFIIKYRFRKGVEPKPTAKSNMVIEVIWTVIPFLVVAAVFWVGFKAYMKMAVPPADAYEIQVVGQKWKWLFEYPNGWVDDTLHVPGDRPILLTMRSEDVIHSLAIPAFRLKMDVVPGRYNKAWFKPKMTGEFDIYCTEYCGTGHSDMLAKVVVHEPGGYEKWLREASSLLSPTFKPSDLLDPSGMLTRMKRKADPIATFVEASLSADGRAALAAWNPSMPVSDDMKTTLVMELNTLIKAGPIHDEARFAGVPLADETKALLELSPEGEELTQLNRFLLSDAFPDAFTRGPDMVEAGRYIYDRKGACASCHKIDGSANIGPPLNAKVGREEWIEGGEKIVFDENYIRESILAPQAKIALGYKDRAVMPTYKGRLSDREIDALIAFLKSLKE